MSYARFTKDSNVYVFMNVNGYLECCGCGLNEDADCFKADSTKEMVLHLLEHVNNGHAVEADTFAEILDDDQENFPREK